MSPIRFPRVAILKDSEIIEYGYLNKDMPQNDGSYLYEIYGDSARTYLLKGEEFLYVRETESDSK
jgi:hypothetical protein